MENLQSTNGYMSALAPSATLAITAKAKEMQQQGLDICSMCAGEPDFDTPEPIKEACIQALRDGQVNYTPASGLVELRKMCAEKFVSENGLNSTWQQVVVAPGAKYSVFTAIAALCGPGDEVLIPAPYWLSYPEMVAATGATTIAINTKAENNYELDPDDLEASITENTRLLILTTPSNPTGIVYRRETLERIAEIAVRKNIMILSDEIYEKLVYNSARPHISIGSLSPEVNDLTITVNGLSKTYAMTGWRLGYLTAPLWLTKRIIAFQSNTTSNATTFAQYGAMAALRGDAKADVDMMIGKFAERCELIYNLLKDIPGLRCVKPEGAFYIFCDISSFGIGSVEFADRLLNEANLAVIPCLAFGADDCIRLSYACSEESIKTAADRLRTFCASL